MKGGCRAPDCLVAAAGFSVAGAAAPLELKLCIFDHPFPPMTYPDGSGQAQDVLRRASRLQPVQIQTVVAPRFQCMEQLRTGQVDAMLAAFIEERTAYSAFPMKDSQPDASRAVGEVNFPCRAGTAARWTGTASNSSTSAGSRSARSRACCMCRCCASSTW
jgi:hypothetical protein